MPTIPDLEVKEFLIAGTNWTVDLTQLTSEYYIYGSGTLVGSCSMSGIGTPLDGMVLNIYYTGNFSLNGNTITIFGVSLTQQQSSTHCYIKTRYDSVTASWQTMVFADDSELPVGVEGVNIFPLTAGGGTNTLISGIAKKYHQITGSGVNLLGSWVWQGGGSPMAGDNFIIHYNATNTVLAGNTITIFGKVLTALQATAGNCIVFARWTGSTWDSILIDGYSVDTFRVMGSAADTAPAYLDTKVKNSIEVDSNQIQLENDSAAPGNNMIYSTTGAGVRGWRTAAALGAGIWEVGTGALSAQTVGTGCSASGDKSVSCGENTTASGADAFAEGNATTASGVSSHSEGSGTIASGQDAHAQNTFTIASALSSHSQGYHSVAHLFASSAYSCGKFNINGDCEELKLFLKRATTNAVAANMLLGDGVTTGIEIPTDCTVDFHVRYVALVTGGVAGTAGDTMVQEQKFSVQNLAGALTLLTQAQVTTAGITVVAGNIIKYDAATINALACDLTPTIAGTKLLFTVTGVADTDINHGCLVNMVIMGHNNFSI